MKDFFYMVILVTILTGAGLFVFNIFDSRSGLLKPLPGSPLQNLGSNQLTSINQDTPEKQTPLGKLVLEDLEGTKGSYAIVVENFRTGEKFAFNEHRIYETASLYKLWVMATAFKQIDAGTLKDTEVLSGDIAAINDAFDIADEDADLTEGSISLTVAQALDQMITISHNYSALLLTQRVKFSNVAQLLKDYELNESGVGLYGGFPTTSASDISVFFKKLYLGKLGSKQSTDKMITLLKRQKLNNKLPRLMPQGIEIAHKTGELNSYSHDAGIVYSPNGDYSIVVLTDTQDPNLAEDRIASLGKDIYTYFANE